VQPASVSSRFAAMNLDFLIVGAISQGICMAIDSAAPELATTGNLLLLSFIISTLYFVIPTKTSGQTLGKMLLSIKVIPYNDHQGEISWGQAFLREAVGKMISTAALFLGYVFAYLNADRKTWHDSMSNTQVISLVVEQEKTAAQKLQQVFLAIISVPAGVGLILVALLYTSFPLNSIKEKIEASGIQVGSLTGSLGGGLRMTDIKRHDDKQNFSFGAVEVKFNLWSLLTEKAFYIEKVTAEEGHIEVPEDFSLSVILSNLLAIVQNIDGQNINMRDFTLSKIHFKNIYFEHNKKVLSHLQEFSVKGIALVSNELYVTELLFQVVGFKFKAADIKSSFGRIEVGKASGGVTPEYLPLLKVPVDFHVKGSIGKNTKSMKIEAGLVIDKVKINYENEKLTASVDKMILNEVFRTAVPVEDLDMKLSAQGGTILNLLTSLKVEYGAKICGNEFPANPEKGPTLERNSHQFHFSMTPLPVLDFTQVVFAPEATLDDLFGYQLRGNKLSPPDFASAQEMLADLCFQKNYAELKSEELETLKPLEKVVQTGRGSGYAGYTAAVAAVKPSPTPEAEVAPTVMPTVTPAPALGVNPSPSPSPSVSPSVTVTPSATPSPTVTPTTSPTAPPAPTAAPSLSPSPVVSPSVTPEASVTPAAAVSPAPTVKLSPQETMKKALADAKALLKQGKIAEAKTTIETPMVVIEGMTPAELGAFYNLKAWLNLYTGGMTNAAQNFELAFKARRDIGDAEGLHRSYEALKNDQDAKKWLEYIRVVTKANPDLKNQLTPNMQKKLNEASAGSRP
jgi:uncharacterized RDD family membrane protein YckC